MTEGPLNLIVEKIFRKCQDIGLGRSEVSLNIERRPDLSDGISFIIFLNPLRDGLFRRESSITCLAEY